MDDRDSTPDISDTPRPARSRRDDPRGSARVADDEPTTSWSHGTESSYSAAAPLGARPAQRHCDDAPLEVRIEFVRLDGPAGQALRRRQAQIMLKVLQWIAEHPDPANQEKMPS